MLLQHYSQVERTVDGESWTLKDPANWWPQSMPSLAQFPPILMVEEAQMETAIFEISERVQSRFHRTQRFPTADDVVSYLRDYSSWRAVWGAFLLDDTESGNSDSDSGAGADGAAAQEGDEADADARRRTAIEQQVARAFAQIDTDGNNFIDEQELAVFMDKNKLGISTQDISSIMQTADIDCDGMLSLDELKLAILTVWENERKAQQEQH